MTNEMLFDDGELRIDVESNSDVLTIDIDEWEGTLPHRSIVIYRYYDHQCSLIFAYPGTNRAMSARIRSNKEIPVIIAF